MQRKVIDYTISNVTRPGQTPRIGDTIDLKITGLSVPVYKILRIYNPMGPRFVYLTEDLPQQYQLNGNNDQYHIGTMRIVLTGSGTIHLTGGYIYETWMGSKLGSELSQGNTGEIAPQEENVFSVLPDLSFEVADYTGYTGQVQVNTEVETGNTVRAGQKITINLLNLPTDEITAKYLPTGNPLTLESILYGLAAGCMLCAVLLWFVCYNRVLTSDKFVYLFGRVIPALSLVLSMTLRFVPRFKQQMDTVRQSQFCIGRDASSGSVWQRARKAVTIFSIMVTWALENAIETADSMKSRGYGLKGRTAFSIFRMEERDRYALLWLGFCGVYLTCGAIAGGLKWWYFPALTGTLAQPMTVSFYLVYLALCLTPVILDRREARAWRCSPSRT